MPNNITNKLTIIGDKEQVQEVLEFIQMEEDSEDYDGFSGIGTIDFNKIIPMPDNIYRGDLSSEKRKENPNNWYDWSVQNWGTKWNAYKQGMSYEEDDNTLCFETAWSGIPNLMQKLSSMFPDVTIDYSKCSDKSALDGGSGVVLSSGYNNMWISDFVSVEPGKTIEFSSEPYKVCYYTSDKTFIKQDKFTTSDTMTKTYTIPDNASYIRFQYCSDSSYDVPAVSFINRTTISINYVD